MLDECIDDGLSIFAGYSYQHHVTCMTLNQGCDLTVVAADDQVTFPVTRHSPIFYRSRPLADRDGAGNPAMCSRLLRVTTPAAHRSCAPQVLQQLFLQGPAGLDKEALVDRLV